MYQSSRQPITDANYAAFEAAARANPKSLVSNAATSPRVVNAQVMGDWMLSHPDATDTDLGKVFTAAERRRFQADAIEYAIRRSGGVH